MSDPSLSTQEAIFDALEAACSPTKVYNHVKQGTSYPYVVMDGSAITPDDPLAKRRDEQYFYLSVWSQYKGEKEILEIMKKIYDALHQRKLPSSTGRIVRVYVQSRITRREPDNLTYQGTMTLRVIVEH